MAVEYNENHKRDAEIARVYRKTQKERETKCHWFDDAHEMSQWLFYNVHRVISI